MRSFSTYSVTSSSTVASLPRIRRVSLKRAPTPDRLSDRNSMFTMSGMALEKFSMCATVSKTVSIGA
jgi:hypothetical protein